MSHSSRFPCPKKAPELRDTVGPLPDRLYCEYNGLLHRGQTRGVSERRRGVPPSIRRSHRDLFSPVPRTTIATCPDDLFHTARIRLPLRNRLRNTFCPSASFRTPCRSKSRRSYVGVGERTSQTGRDFETLSELCDALSRQSPPVPISSEYGTPPKIPAPGATASRPSRVRRGRRTAGPVVHLGEGAPASSGPAGAGSRTSAKTERTIRSS